MQVEKELISKEKIKLSIKTDNFARFVKISGSLDGIKLSDNYFNIMPGEEKVVIIDGKDRIILEKINIKVSAINEK